VQMHGPRPTVTLPIPKGGSRAATRMAQAGHDFGVWMGSVLNI
jgi:hypothetical protein